MADPTPSNNPESQPAKSAVAEHMFTLPMLVATIGSFAGFVAVAGFFPDSSPWQRLLQATVAGTPPLIALLGQLWHSRNIKDKVNIANALTDEEHEVVQARRSQAKVADSKSITTAGDIVRGKSALPLILFPLLFTFGCGHIPVVPSSPPSAQYEAALVQCLQDEGIPAAPVVGAQVWNILMTPGWTQDQVIAKLEAIGVTIGGKGAQIIVSCSVLSWFEIFPVASGTAPTPAQAAARVYKAKYRKVLKAHDTGAHASLDRHVFDVLDMSMGGGVL